MTDIPQELEWMQMGKHQLLSAAKGSGGLGTDDTTFSVKGGAEFVCCSGRPLDCPSQ